MNIKIINKNPFILPFIWGFILVGYYIFPERVSLITVSGDAHSIWQTIISFRSEKITSSYVLYKGFLSVYPYVWLYDSAINFGLNEFIFIKIYHALLFAFVASVGVPYIISQIILVKIRLIRNLIFVTLIFYLTKFTLIYDALMIDLPSWAFFVAATSLLLYIKDDLELKWGRIPFYFIAGLLVGLCGAASGQYSISALLLALYFVVSCISSMKKNKIIGYKSILVILVIFAFGISIPKLYDKNFEATIVQPMRDAGEWLPTGNQWLVSGFTRLIYRYKYGYPDVSNRGMAILKKTEGDKFNARFELIKLGGGAYTVVEYLKIIRLNIVDFCVMWFTKAFIAISFDGGAAKILHLFIAYSSVFFSIYLLFAKIKNFYQLLHRNALIFMAFLSSLIAPIILFVDMRYAVCVYSLLLGVIVFQSKVGLDSYVFSNNINQKKSMLHQNQGMRIPYAFFAYILFIIFGFTLYGAILEIPGSDPNLILFK